jgi:hypothetical protein
VGLSLKRFFRYVFISLAIVAGAFLSMANKPFLVTHTAANPMWPQQPDTSRMQYPIPQDDGNPYNQLDQQSPLYLSEPEISNVKWCMTPLPASMFFIAKLATSTTVRLPP